MTSGARVRIRLARCHAYAARRILTIVLIVWRRACSITGFNANLPTAQVSRLTTGARIYPWFTAIGAVGAELTEERLVTSPVVAVPARVRTPLGRRPRATIVAIGSVTTYSGASVVTCSIIGILTCIMAEISRRWRCRRRRRSWCGAATFAAACAAVGLHDVPRDAV